MNISTKSYIYTGTIRHRRFTPFDYFFSYPLFMVYLDLKSFEKSFKKSWIWNVNRSALVSFMRDDYHGNNNIDLDTSVRKTIYKKIGKNIKGPIRLLTNLRYFGYCFNPVSFYYCFDEADTKVEVIMAEVTNTPWKERHSYIIKNNNKNIRPKNISIKLDKKLHVSPFWGMDHQYEWFFSEPSKRLLVNMKNFKDKNKVFDAKLIMNRTPFSLKNLIKQVVKFPFITAVIVFRIHWHALKLWLKKAPFYIHPDKVNIMKGS
tara:strand:+ start:249 stop:1031 length:783 start_codon:yes stop_codon:yes gene_type:complete